jgi:filamentous hemagglutinin family protein
MGLAIALGSAWRLMPGAIAQITPNTTWGSEASTVTTVAPNQVEIDGGAMRATNLFHDFSDFNIAPNGSVYFRNPAGIDIIITRVTGGTASNLDGVLGVLGPADLFLLNPSGIVFGANATLDMRGAFVASTASGLLFGTQGVFPVQGGNAPPLLTIQPTALQFTEAATAIAPITLQPGAALAVDPGQSLLLVGGDVTLNNGSMSALGGHLTLAAVGGPGTVALDREGDRLAGQVPSASRAAITLTNASQLNAAAGGGSIALFAQDLSLNNESQIVGGVADNLGTTALPGATISINATGTTRLDNRSRIRSGTSSGSSAPSGGDIQVQTRTLDLQNGSAILMDQQGGGAAGQLTISASDSATLSGCSPPQGDNGCDFFNRDTLTRIGAEMGELATGTAGQVRVTTPTLTMDQFAQISSFSEGNTTASALVVNVDTATLTNAARIISRAIGQGNSGSVQVNATGTIQLSGRERSLDARGRRRDIESGIYSDTAEEGTTGSGGALILTADLLQVTNRAEVSGETRGLGDGGAIFITANAVEVTNRGQIITRTTQNVDGVSGNAGSITINTRGGDSGGTVSVLDDSSRIIAEVGKNSAGNGGTVRINTGTLTVNGRALVTAGNRSRLAANSQGGNVIVTADEVRLLQGGRLEARTDARGNGGNITVNTNGGLVYVAGRRGNIESGIRADAVPDGSFRDDVTETGDIQITTGRFIAEDGAELGTEHRGTGQSGTVTLTAERIRISGGSTIFAQVQRQAIGGNIIINGQGGTILLTGQNTALSAATAGTGNAGTVSIHNADTVRVVDRAQIVTETRTSGSGDGGPVTIQAGRLIVRGRSRVSASNRSREQPSSQGGDVSVMANQVLLLEGGRLEARTTGVGNGGSVRVNTQGGRVYAAGRVGEIESGLRADAIPDSGFGDALTQAGNITIRTGTLIAEDDAEIAVEHRGTGQGGTATITARRIRLGSGSAILAQVQNQAQGGDIVLDSNGGSLVLTGLDLPNGVQSSSSRVTRLSATTQGTGTAGSIEVRNAAAMRVLDGAQVVAETGASGSGDGGQIGIAATRLVVQGQSALGRSLVSTSNRSEVAPGSQGGDIQVTANRVLLLAGGRLEARTTGVGDGGSIVVNAQGGRVYAAGQLADLAPDLSNSDLSNLNQANPNQANAPAIAPGSAASTPSEPLPDGESGIRADAVPEAEFLTSPTQAGSITITTGALTAEDGAQIGVEHRGTGQSGEIVITAPSIHLGSGATISAQVQNQAVGGNIRLNGQGGHIRLTGGALSPGSSSGVTPSGPTQLSVATQGTGTGGNLTISNAETVSLTDGAQIVADTRSPQAGAGNSGRILIREVSQVDLSGTNPQTPDQGSTLSARTTGAGNAGRIALRDVQQLTVTEGATIEAIATEAASGSGGDIIVQAQRVQLGTGGAIAASSAGSSNGGNIRINTDQLQLNDGSITAQVSAGRAGNLQIQAGRSLQLQGNQSQISIAATNSAGVAGDLRLISPEITVREGATITVSNPQGQAGNLTLAATNLILNRGTLSAQTGGTGATSGANIGLNIANVLSLRNNSLISAEALQQANGGSIFVNAGNGFLAAVPQENGDLIANAQQGRGGEIRLQALGVFGMTVQTGLTTEQLRLNRTSDISASSDEGPQGIVTIATPGDDPSRGLAELPANLIDATNQVAQGCGSQEQRQNQFVRTGRGGLPLNPAELQRPNSVVVDWAQLTAEPTTRAESTPPSTASGSGDSSSPASNLVEAQGWYRSETGDVMLLATSDHAPSSNSQPCQ